MKSQSYQNQHGSSKLSAVVALSIVGLLIYALINIIPASYQIMNFKTEMKNSVVQVLAMPVSADKPNEKIKAKIKRVAGENGIPPSLTVDVAEAGKEIRTHVKFTRPIDVLPFGIYKYNYEFDETVTENR
jgi:hypothetical protein